MIIRRREFHPSNSEILDLEYFTLKIPQSLILLDFKKTGTKMFEKALSIIKIYLKWKRWLMRPKNMNNHEKPVKIC